MAVLQIADGAAQSLLPKQPTIRVAEIVGEEDETMRTPEPKVAAAANVWTPVVKAEATSKVH